MPTRWTVEKLVEDCFEDWPPVKPQTFESRLSYVREWLREKVRPHEHAALALMARVDAILRETQAALPMRERERFFHRIDDQHLVKSPDSILDKMLRDREGDTSGQPRNSFNNFRDQMDDLGRFRIVTNFLSDAEAIERALKGAYASAARNLSDAQKALRDEFLLKDNCFEDRIWMAPSKRCKGERCYRGCFWPAGKSSLKVEVQIMTALAEAWDKKDHFLVYEPRRQAQPVPLRDEIEMYAYSELLYLADLFFDQFKRRSSGAGGTP